MTKMSLKPEYQLIYSWRQCLSLKQKSRFSLCSVKTKEIRHKYFPDSYLTIASLSPLTPMENLGFSWDQFLKLMKQVCLPSQRLATFLNWISIKKRFVHVIRRSWQRHFWSPCTTPDFKRNQLLTTNDEPTKNVIHISKCLPLFQTSLSKS